MNHTARLVFVHVHTYVCTDAECMTQIRMYVAPMTLAKKKKTQTNADVVMVKLMQ